MHNMLIYSTSAARSFRISSRTFVRSLFEELLAAADHDVDGQQEDDEPHKDVVEGRWKQEAHVLERHVSFPNTCWVGTSSAAPLDKTCGICASSLGTWMIERMHFPGIGIHGVERHVLLARRKNCIARAACISLIRFRGWLHLGIPWQTLHRLKLPLDMNVVEPHIISDSLLGNVLEHGSPCPGLP